VCVWCPGDALCSALAITGDTWRRLGEEAEYRNELQPSCTAVEEWESTCSSSSNTTTDSLFSDPLFDAMRWVYDMINVIPVWESGGRGQGIRIRVNDLGGVDATHAEYNDRFDRTSSCSKFEQPSDAPSQVVQHGTAVASLALGGADNNQCAVGIAPQAILSACTVPETTSPKFMANIIAHKLDAMDISVNSWSVEACLLRDRFQQRVLQQQDTACPFSNMISTSPCSVCGTEFIDYNSTSYGLSAACELAIAVYCTSRFEEDPEACSQYLSSYAECDYNPVLSKEEESALEEGVLKGRDGKGIIFVMPAGNGYVLGDTTNNQGWVNTRYTISVGAVDKKGEHASYSATGASLMVSAPGGDINHLSNNWVAHSGGGCHDIGPGTSFSAPVVAGGIALLLEANPELSWRDIQGILAETSQRVHPTSTSWTKNGADFEHSYEYGFGILDVEAAMVAARSWLPWTPEDSLRQDSGVINLSIPTQDKVATTLSFNQQARAAFQVESVTVVLEIEHPSRGDLTIVLTSPQGTESILHFGKRPENRHLAAGSQWELMTVRNWGEFPAGDWELSIQDDKLGNLQDSCADIPWSFIQDAVPGAPTGARVTCASIRSNKACADGQVVKQAIRMLANAETLLTPDRACCTCGGGMQPSTSSILVSWSLLVHGRSPGNDKSASGSVRARLSRIFVLQTLGMLWATSLLL